MNKTLTTQTRR